MGIRTPDLLHAMRLRRIGQGRTESDRVGWGASHLHEQSEAAHKSRETTEYVGSRPWLPQTTSPTLPRDQVRVAAPSFDRAWATIGEFGGERRTCQ
jgi:hypothetical protein